MSNECFINDCLSKYHYDDLDTFMVACEKDVQKYAHDKIKTIEEFGYNVIVIWQDDYNNNKKDILNYLSSLYEWKSCSL